jgi:hypothetical protein
MPKKKANEATIAPPPVSIASVPAVKKTRTKVAVSSVEVTTPNAAAPRKKAASKKIAEPLSESIANLAGAVEVPVAISATEIEERAYQSWIERGCPMGSPEEDWYRAERELIARFATASH